jgi:kynureninase
VHRENPQRARAPGRPRGARAPDAQLLSLALRQRQIVPDYRAPNLLRLAPVALYTTEAELDETVRVLCELLQSGSHRGMTASSAVT